MRSYPERSDGQGLRIGIVVARFNHLISVRLLEGAREALAKAGARPEDVHVAWVPGAFEIPLAARTMARSGRYHALVALGAVIRGGTPHFEYVCRGVTDGVREVMQATGIPVAFGVLTTDDVDQALERAGGAEGNKGAEAAQAALEMAHLCAALAAPPPAGGVRGRTRGARRATESGPAQRAAGERSSGRATEPGPAQRPSRSRAASRRRAEEQS